jgi:hypothetical protein
MAFVLALCTALAMTGAVVAKDHTAPGNSGAHGNGHGGTTAASLKVKGNASHPGGVFRVLAVLHAAKDLRPPTVNAIVHFATGDVAIVLTRSGNGAAYHGNVPVPAAEPAGTVKIDATAIVNGITLTATGSGKIVVETTETTTETSEASETSETSTTATETSTTCTITTTETSTTTVTATETSTTSETSATDESSEGSESSEASESSDNDESDSCDDDSAHPSSFVLNPQSMREFVAFLAALIN